MFEAIARETEHDWRQEAYELASAKLATLGERFPKVLLFPRRVIVAADASGLRVVRRPIPAFTGRAALVGKYIILGKSVGSREARFAGFHELNHHWLGTTHPLDVIDGSRGGSRYEEVMADAGAGAVLAPHPELRRVLAVALKERAVASLSPRAIEEWADLEVRLGGLRAAVERFDVNYDVVVRSLADAGLVRGVEPWTEHTWVVTAYKACRARLMTPGARQRLTVAAGGVGPRAADEDELESLTTGDLEESVDGAKAERIVEAAQWLHLSEHDVRRLMSLGLEEVERFIAEAGVDWDALRD